MEGLKSPAQGSSARRAVWITAGAVTLATALLVVPLALAAAEAKQPLPRVASRARVVASRSPALDSSADQEQAGEPVEGGGGEVGAAWPGWARSIEARRSGAQVRSSPDVRSSERRGQLAPGARFPLLDRWLGRGCTSGPWYRIGEAAWVCADQVTLVQAEPAVAPYPALDDDELVPFRYAFSGGSGVRTYARPNDIRGGDSVEALGSNWGVAVVASELWQGQPVVRTTRGTWVAARELRWVEPSSFVGTHLAERQPATTLSIAWVRRGGAPSYAHPGDRQHAGRLRGRALVEAGDEVRVGAETFTRLGDGRFVESRLVVRPARIAPPEGVAPGERWIDVDLDRQTLVAYEGAQPIYATLVSTGRRPGSTPRGLHRIWVKIAHDTMDNVEDEDADHTYSMDGVPWIQYFTEDVALHGVYWHDRFGQVSSHGCVNLAPRDARWLYAFTRPHVPDGWSIVRATTREPGTPVHVH